MATDYQVTRRLRIAQSLQVVCLAAIISYATILYRIWAYDIMSILAVDDFLITILTIVLCIFAFCMLIVGYLLPWLVIKWSKQSKYNLLVLLICRPAIFEAIALYGLILGFTGAKWQTWLSFFVVAFVALLLSFPTKGRWKKTINLRNIALQEY